MGKGWPPRDAGYQPGYSWHSQVLCRKGRVHTIALSHTPVGKGDTENKTSLALCPGTTISVSPKCNGGAGRACLSLLESSWYYRPVPPSLLRVKL